MEKTKKQICISLDKSLSDIIERKIQNRSKYIEWLIYQDMLKNNNENVKNIII
jgi:hypothetical protein